jgi:hypothetical protein
MKLFLVGHGPAAANPVRVMSVSIHPSNAISLLAG